MASRIRSVSSVRRTAASAEGFRSRRRRPPGRSEEVFRATLTGLEEVPAIFTPATGSFVARLTAEGNALEYELSFSQLEYQVMV